mmetsp:Transcript_12206/g.22962  ORF Transcript_12206/g.22962 Transcript_12206/m.22962 type:complete len:238 (-) Transcript_12206:108-821(-)|eukprot:CAMPEP_0197474736 /NCGR_PEP_ID=MMETSP1309-20131121/6203_1 /TAXON_ID=464262 /ORGANISM="Genus nov. species nov., Strain RCC998" /LENGTH=237 /DNA_ID=CAMNT_0043014511 /DNA_START=258 /DNA_END=971 /DNA_ORIENTATION=-
MASVSAANLSTKAKIDLVVGSSLPAFSEEVISNKNPRNWNDLPEHILLRIFDSLAKEADNGRVWVSHAGRVCKAWRRVFKDLLLGDTAASRPKRVQMIGSEVHDNKTTLATKGDLVEESVVNYSAEVCSNKRPRVEHFPAFSGEVVAANQVKEELSEAQNEEVFVNGSVGQVQPQVSADETGDAQRSTQLDNAEEGPCPSSNEGQCRSSYLTHVNSIVRNTLCMLGSPMMQTTSTET